MRRSTKRFLVTGGAGFIGSHIAETLVKKGHFVRVLDNFSKGRLENLKSVINKIDLIKGCICSLKTCLKAAKGIDFILHQAALKSVPQSLINPEEYNEVNIQGTLNLLKTAVQSKIKGFTFASSSSVYGDPEIFPEKESLSPQPISPYALTKLTGEHYCKLFSYHYNLPCVSLRYFNVFGPRQSLDDEYAVVIPKFITCMLNGQSPPIYGTGRQTRDFIYVSNVADINIVAAQNNTFRGEIFNVASGKEWTVLKLVEVLNRLMNKNLKPVFLPPRQGDVFRSLADISKLKKNINEVDFIEGLKLTIEYFKGNQKV